MFIARIQMIFVIDGKDVKASGGAAGGNKYSVAIVLVFGG